VFGDWDPFILQQDGTTHDGTVLPEKFISWLWHNALSVMHALCDDEGRLPRVSVDGGLKIVSNVEHDIRLNSGRGEAYQDRKCAGEFTFHWSLPGKQRLYHGASMDGNPALPLQASPAFWRHRL
jgi:hypothetical protein